MEIDKKGLKSPVPIIKILKEVAEHYDLKVEELCVTKRGQGQKNVPRWIAMKLC